MYSLLSEMVSMIKDFGKYILFVDKDEKAYFCLLIGHERDCRSTKWLIHKNIFFLNILK